MTTREEIKKGISDLKQISYNNEGLFSEAIDSLEDMLDENKYRVAIIGEFSSGKSTFLNALIGSSVLYSSDSEATGVITYIESADEKKAYVHMKNGQVEGVGLDTVEDCKGLRKYLDLDQSSHQVDWVGINYPMKGIDQEVCFIDTPGLEGISKTQMETTKKILKEANAVIMLITQKGLSGTELAILSGKYEGFGKVNARDVIVVINKINNVFKPDRTYGESLEKIQVIKQNVATTLKENGLEHIKLFALDSRDYLWSKDHQLYDYIVKNTDPAIENILTQEEYRGRSQFDGFKDFLLMFLEEGERNRNFLEDITDKLNCIIDEFTYYFNGIKEKQAIDQKQSIDFINQQRKLLLENKRKLYNTLVRYLSGTFSEFQEGAVEDVLMQRKKVNKELIKYINQSFETLEDLNNSHLIKNCYKSLNGWIKEDANTFKGQVEAFQNHIAHYLIAKQINENLYKTLKEKMTVKLNIESKDIKLDLIYKEDGKLTEEEMIDAIEGEIAENTRRIYILQREIEKLEKDLKAEGKLNNDYKAKEREMKSAVDAIGKRPTPKTKYREVTRTRRKFLFFTETYTDWVEDGLDYSNVQEWQKKLDQVYYKYHKHLDVIMEQLDELNNKKLLVKEQNRQLGQANKKDGELKQQLLEMKDIIKEKKLKKEKEYIDTKKNEIYKHMENYCNHQYNLVSELIQNNLYNINRSIKKQIQEHLETYLSNYEESLNNKIASISQKKCNVHLVEDLRILNKLKELI